MKNSTSLLIVANLLLVIFAITLINIKKQSRDHIQEISISNDAKELPIEVPKEIIKITNGTPNYLNYEETVNQLKEWNKEVPNFTEVKTYGKSAKGIDLYYICLSNEALKANKPSILITACIHGNEPLASSVTMWHIGALLQSYSKDESVKNLLNSYSIYFVPVVSPDTYPNVRLIKGVDPNRNFSADNSLEVVDCLKKLYNQINPKLVISGHTSGRIVLFPYGDKMENCPDHSSYIKLLTRVNSLSGYDFIRACDMYNKVERNRIFPIRKAIELNPEEYEISDEYDIKANVPIIGSEIDWYYKNGSFAVVMEYGTHQRIPTSQEIKTEFDKTFTSIIYLLQEAPKVKITFR